MRRFLLSLAVVFMATMSALAQTASFEWGTAKWNISDGATYSSIDDFNKEGVVLIYPNEANFGFTFLNVVRVDYDVYVDDNTEAEAYGSSAQGGCAVTLDYWFVEGHKYTIKTKRATLAQANLATRVTDTLSVSNDSYSISFSIAGPELVKTIDVEGTMALTITNQEYTKTVSKIDSKSITDALGISSMSEATIYGLNVNGAYNPYWSTTFDGWRDADGELTTYGGRGYNNVFGHNAYPSVYCIKLNEAADSVTYYFYDIRKEYDPEDSGTVGGGTLTRSMTERPNTSSHTVIWDWDNGDGTITKYSRYYLCDEGTDYKASFMILANGKAVKINATLHFVSEADYAEYLKGQAETYNGTVAIGVAPAQAPTSPIMTTYEAQTITVAAGSAEDKVNVTWSGITIMPMNLPTGEMTFTDVTVTTDAEGNKTFVSEPTQIAVMMGGMTIGYNAQLTGVQTADAELPAFVLKLSQATVVAAVFAADEASAKAALDAYYAVESSVDGVAADDAVEAIYSVGGVRQSSLSEGVNIVKKGGKTVKVIK